MYEVQTHTHSGNNFYAGSSFPQMTAAALVAESIGKYAPVVITDGKISPAVKTVTDGEGEEAVTTTAVTTDGLYGIALEAGEADETIPVLLTGEVHTSALNIPEDTDTTALTAAFRNLCIFLK